MSIYDQIADWMVAHRTTALIEREYVELIRQHISSPATILDLGCGFARPIAEYFINHGYQITGVDQSEKMLAYAKRDFPGQTWIHADMTSIELAEQFDTVIAWHSFFHLKHELQRLMFPRFAAWCKPGALLVFTSGTEYDEVWSDNGGVDLYHASLASSEYKQLLLDNSFKVILHRVEDPKCGNATIWVAQKL